MSLPEEDVILFNGETTPFHQEHTIVHEACHILCGHQPIHDARSAGAIALFPDIGVAAVQGVLHRSNYATEDEQEAEILALLIARRADRTPTTETNREPALDAILRRLRAFYEGKRH